MQAAQLHKLMIGVADLAERGPAIDRDLANFTGRQHDGRPTAFLVGQLSVAAGRSTDVCPLPGSSSMA